MKSLHNFLVNNRVNNNFTVPTAMSLDELKEGYYFKIYSKTNLGSDYELGIFGAADITVNDAMNITLLPTYVCVKFTNTVCAMSMLGYTDKYKFVELTKEDIDMLNKIYAYTNKKHIIKHGSKNLEDYRANYVLGNVDDVNKNFKL